VDTRGCVRCAANMPNTAAARRLTSLRDQLFDLEPTNAASAAQEAPQDAHSTGSAQQQFRLTDSEVAAFVADGFVVLPNLVEAGDIDQSVCDEIFELGYAQRDKPGMGPSRTELFEKISPSMNAVMASPTLRGGLESLLGPGYFQPPWNTHLHINGTGDGGFHADGTDHGPTQTTVRGKCPLHCGALDPAAFSEAHPPLLRCADHRPRQIFGFFYPGDVPLENGPTAVIPGSHYPAVDRIDPTSHLHVVNSEDGLPQEMPEHLLQHVLSSEDRLQADVPNKERGPFSNTPAETDEEAALDAADKQRLEVAAAMLGVEKVDEVKLTCKAGTVMLVGALALALALTLALALLHGIQVHSRVHSRRKKYPGGPVLQPSTNVPFCCCRCMEQVHHDLFHRASRRLPDVWRPLFVLRDAVRMVEPVAGAPSWRAPGSPPPPADPPVDVTRMNAHAARSPEVQALHRTMWRYLIGEGGEMR
jgi:hypothetical protein